MLEDKECRKMVLTRPYVSVRDCKDGKTVSGSIAMPSVCLTAIRPDHIKYVHTQLAKNARQAYGVSEMSGYQVSAGSWGTGRAVARIPRVHGSGTHRAGQGAFGNMCRGGGMYAPTKTYRRWHRKVNETEKRHATASAIAAASVPAIVMARGHRIDAMPEVPCVVSNDVERMSKSKDVIALLKKLGLEVELERCKDSKTIRAGKGKLRNNRYTQRRGVLFVYAGDNECTKAFRNIPGVECCHVSRLNLLQLAPGGLVGRLCLYSEDAFKQLQTVWGAPNGGADKKGYVLPRGLMTNTDISRIINSNEIQSVLNPAKKGTPKRTQHKNPLTNHAVKCRLNPAIKARKTQAK